ncbi:hypothetical protein C8Q77DRAFT_438065 [Trametes polyzona]|nr:hypothetical protein C8Q77DRAFT_438065 [Trametes polyzona]
MLGRCCAPSGCTYRPLPPSHVPAMRAARLPTAFVPCAARRKHRYSVAVWAPRYSSSASFAVLPQAPTSSNPAWPPNRSGPPCAVASSDFSSRRLQTARTASSCNFKPCGFHSQDRHRPFPREDAPVAAQKGRYWTCIMRVVQSRGCDELAAATAVREQIESHRATHDHWMQIPCIHATTSANAKQLH